MQFFKDSLNGYHPSFSYIILLFAVCILGYLWYNATPSRLMMGDAGSRSMGLFISILILWTNDPFLYLPFALVLLIDGGIGLGKVFLLRVFRIRILKKVQTPLHDHVRKGWKWSNTQTVFRFAIIQGILNAALLYWIVQK
jgi:phospho-N-acetylmuramoyl-pentapeptide-transferase